MRCILIGVLYASVVDAALGDLALPRRRRPSLAPAWRADVRMLNAGYIYHDTAGTFLSDSAHSRFRLTVDTHTSVYHPGEVQALDVLIKNVSGYYLNFTYGPGKDGACHPFTVPRRSYDEVHGDPFWFLPYSWYNATLYLDGEVCECWGVTNRSMTAVVCIAPDGAPRLLGHDTSSLFSYTTSTLGGLLMFTNVKVGPLPDTDFASTDACGVDFPPPLCQSSGSGITELDIYRVQGTAEPLELGNRNTGDALGDMFFTCAANAGSTGKGKYAAYYKVMANSSWGPFNQCQYDASSGLNYCVGMPGTQVGRGTPESLGGQLRGGQCSDNSELGSWYSFPAEGECAPGEAIGKDGCTWSAKLERVVELSCILIERGLTESCKEELGHPPFERSAAIFEAALAFDDPSLGGCPSVTDLRVNAEFEMFA